MTSLGSSGTKRVALVVGASVWAVSLLLLFLRHRGDDAGRLPELLGAVLVSLTHSPILGTAGLAESAGGLAIAALIVLAWYGLGDMVARAAARGEQAPDSTAIELASRCLYGAGAWSMIWFLLGITHRYHPAVAATALGVSVGLTALARWRLTPSGSTCPAGGLARVAIASIGIVQGLALTSALAPPTARDALFYHFAIPKAYIAAGGSSIVPDNMATFYPQLVEMQVVWAMLVGQLGNARLGEAAAGAVTFAFAPLLVLVIYGWARERGLDSTSAAIAALMVAAIPTTYDVAASGYVDHALTAYSALTVRAFSQWWATLDRGWIGPVALAVGGTLAIKLTAAFLVLPLALLVLVRALRASRGSAAPAGDRGTPGTIVAAGAGALALGVALAAPWYLRTWARTGSPVFPFYLDIWPGAAPGWDLDRSRLYRTLLSLYGDSRTPLDYLLAPLRLSLLAQPDQPGHYDGVLGFSFLLGLPVLAWALARRRLCPDLRLAALVSAVMFAAWLFASQQVRFLLPALPGLAVAIAAAVVAGDRRLGRLFSWLLLGAGAAGIAVILAWFAEGNPLRVVLGGESRDDYLTRRLDYYPYYEIINRDLPATARVWLINMRRDTYHLQRPYFSDFVFEDYTLTRYVRASDSAREMRVRVQAAGISHLLVRHDRLFEYAHSPIVDDHESREHNLAKLALMAAFFEEGTRLLRGDPKFWLIELPAPPG